MLKNTASQSIGAQMVTASDGSAFTGSVTVAVTGDSGTQAAGSVGSAACAHEGGGYHSYRPAQAETNYDHVAFTFSGTGAIPVTVQLFTKAGDAFTRLGAPAGASVSADLAAVKAETASIQADTNDIQTRIPAALVGGRMSSDMVAISGDTTAADNLETAFDDTAGAVPWQFISHQGTLQSVTDSTHVVLASTASAENDVYNGGTIHFVSATTGAKQSALISDYVGSTKAATLAEALPVTLTGAVAYKIAATAPGSGGSGATAAEIADAVWDEPTTGHTTSGTFGEQCKTDIDAILVDTGTTLDARIPAALVSGRMDVSVGAMAANVITAAATAADFGTEVAAAVLTAAAANPIASNLKEINDKPMTGDGQPGTEFSVVGA